MLKQALIIAGGRGRRMGKLTYSQPKCLLEVDGSPLLKYQLDCLTDVERVIISVNQHSGKIIEEYVCNHYSQLNCVFDYALRRGVAHAVYSASKAIDPQQSILITVSDLICFDGYQRLIDKLNYVDIALGVATQQPILDKAYSQAAIDRQGNLQITRQTKKSYLPLIGIYASNNTELLFQYLSTCIESVTNRQISPLVAIEQGIISTNGEFRLSHIFTYLARQGRTFDLVNMGKCSEINRPEDIASASLKAKIDL